MAGVEYQVTKVDPTDPETKGAVYQVNKVTEEVAATLGGKVYRAKVIKNPSEPTVKGKVYQIVIVDPDTSTQGKVYNAIITGDSEAAVVGPAVSPLALPDAVAGELDYVKAFGGTEQNGTPTPDAPMDIVSNNGVLKARHQSGLPIGYKLVDYIKSDASIELDKPTNDTMEFVAEFYRDASGSQYVYQSDTSPSGTANTTAYVATPGNWRFGSRAASISVDIGIKITSVQNVSGVWLNGEKVGTYESMEAFTSNNNLRLFGSQVSPQIRLYSFKVYQNGAPVYDLVPCQRESDSAYGMYDLVSDQFFTNTNATITIGSFVSDPVVVYADGTVETIGIKDSNNLLPVDAQPDVLYPVTVAVAGLWTMSANVNNGQNLTACEIRYYDENRQLVDYQTLVDYSDGRMYKTLRLTTVVKYISISRKTAYATTPVTELKAEIGDTMTPYFNGGTATTEMLLKVGNSQDEQEILTGAVTRNVQVIIFDGTESFSTSSAYGDACVTTGAATRWNCSKAVTPICTHFLGVPQASGVQPVNTCFFNASGHFCFRLEDNTVATFKAWLADQYAAGTPVMVLVNLLTPTTESVAGQTLQVTDGDNTLEITQASLTGLELEAKYKAAVSLTIQEVQDANLDPNVEVTIN